jgi:hypothetical protein
VHLSLSDDMGSVLDMELMVVNEDMAHSLEQRFRKNPEKLYSSLLTVLFADEENQEPD